MDPVQRIILEVGYAALSRSGYNKTTLLRQALGVFVGYGDTCWSDVNLHAPPSVFCATGTGHYISANRLSFVLGLTGPSMPVDTACSSSLVAINVAIKNLRLQ